jgi:hypothetical protein
MSADPIWKKYEDVALSVLNELRTEFGIDNFEEKQQVKGKKSGTVWEIDCKGVRNEDKTFVIVECKRYTATKLTQESVGGLAYRITDVGAAGGFIVSPLGLQEGAQKIAQSANIKSVQISLDSSPEHYLARFLDQIRIGVVESARVSISIKGAYLLAKRFPVESERK